jgi:vacuolar-type H+-ATPase subunit H
MKKFEELEKLVAETREDAEKFFEQGNKAAGTRVRKNMQTLKNLAQEIRSEVQNIKNQE